MYNLQRLCIDDKNSAAKKKVYKDCKQQVQSLLRKMKDARWEAKAAELEEAADNKDKSIL